MPLTVDKGSVIALWGIWEDTPLAAVHAELQRRGITPFFVDQYAVLDTTIELRVESDIQGSLRVGSRSCDLRQISAAYVRSYDSRRLLNGGKAKKDAADQCHALEVDETFGTWLEITSAMVVNRITAMAGNSSKPYQALQIRWSGFDIPDTLITTDSAAALEFWERHGTVIYKSVSSVRSIVSRLTSAHLSRLPDIQWCPTQFQEYVPGTDIRVHVVGQEIFACEILSDADDYRYAERQGAETSIRPYALPDVCADRCLRLAKEMGLLVAGIDLRYTPDGRWYCFEVNPSPGFTYFQDHTNHPIDRAIARLLSEAPDS